jgi:hypothetical protein
VDTVVAKNGDITFSRLPLELLAFAHGSEQWRFGAGLRKALRAKYSESVDGTPDYSTRMTAKPGFILQAEYLWDERGSVFVRYVAEKYEHHYSGWGGQYTDTYKGDHVGVGLSFRF